MTTKITIIILYEDYILYPKILKFRNFFENNVKEIPANISLPQSIFLLRNILGKNGFKLYVVGGAIRDFLRSPNEKPKDIDVCTDASPQEVGQILTQNGISNFPKGEAFGVWVAHIDEEDIEIATFRKDGTYSDGRHPDKVTFADISTDYNRRDLTMNALYYEIPEKPGMPGKIIDHGEGIDHAKNGIVKTVGNARNRFQEDKLRIPRLVRFFSRFNPGHIIHHLDQETLTAIQEFKDLAGVSPERIAAEFTAGLQKALHPVNYLKNYEATGLLPAVFPNLQVDMSDVEKIGNIKNIKVVLAWLLKQENPAVARVQLNRLKYSNDISDAVAFLLKLFRFDIAQVAHLLRQRDLYKQLQTPELQKQSQKIIFKDIKDFAKISGQETELNHFLNYKPTVQSQDFMHLQGKDIKNAMNAAETEKYQQSLKNYKPNH